MDNEPKNFSAKASNDSICHKLKYAVKKAIFRCFHQILNSIILNKVALLLSYIACYIQIVYFVSNFNVFFFYT